MFSEALQAEIGFKLPLSAGELLELLKAAGTCVGGLVYPFKTLEEPEKTNNPRQANVAAPEDVGKNAQANDDNVLKIQRISRDQIPAETVKLIANVLYKNFKTGFSLRNATDLKRFRASAPSLNRESDETLRRLIAGVGRCVDGYVYVILKTGQNYLTRLVEGLFANGCGAIYYETLFERFKTTLREHRFETHAVLQDRLRAYCRNYAFYDEYFEKTETPGSEPKKVLGEIERVWSGDAEITLDVLADRLLIPRAKIRAYLNASPKYAYRGKGVYAKKTSACNGAALAEASENKSTPTTDRGALNGSALDLLRRLLAERFVNGFRLNSTIETERLRKYAQESGVNEGAALAQWDDATLRNAMKQVGILCDGKVYVVDETTDETIRSEIESAFDSGARAVFYEALFERVAASLPDYFSLDLLKDRIKSCRAASDRKIRFAENYLNIYISRRVTTAI